MRFLFLLLLLASACSEAAAGARGRRTSSAVSSAPVTVLAGYRNNLNSWDNTTGGAGDYEGFYTSAAVIAGGTTQFSVCAWTYGTPATAYRDWVGQWGSSQNMWAWQVTNANRMRVSISNASTDGSNYEESTATPYIALQWNHFCFTYNAGTVVLYRNGAVLTSATTGTIPTSIRADTEELSIGSSQTVANADFGQRVDDIVIFSTALSGATVSSLYTTQNPDGFANKLRWWTFDNTGWVDRVAGDTLTELNGTGDYSLNADTPY